MDYILKGDPREVAKVIRENRIRIQRGMICFIPVEPETEIDETLEEADTKEVSEEDVKEVTATKKKRKKSE